MRIVSSERLKTPPDAPAARRRSDAGRRAVALVVPFLLVVLAMSLSGCGEEPPADDPSSAPGTAATGELAQPPSADAPRATQPGFSPDTLRPDTTGDDAAVGLDPPPVTSDLDVDSIVSQYRNHFAAELVDRRTEGPAPGAADVEEAARRRTALDFGYVEPTGAWSDMVADLTGAQRAELAQRIDQANRELGAELRRADPDAEP